MRRGRWFEPSSAHEELPHFRGQFRSGPAGRLRRPDRLAARCMAVPRHV